MPNLNELHERIYEKLEEESYISPQILTNPNYDTLINNKTINVHRDFLKISNGKDVLFDFVNKIESLGIELIPNTIKLTHLYRDSLLKLVEK